MDGDALALILLLVLKEGGGGGGGGPLLGFELGSDILPFKTMNLCYYYYLVSIAAAK